MITRIIFVMEEQCVFRERKKYYFSDFTTPRLPYESPLPHFIYVSMPEDLYVRVRRGTPIPMPSKPENDEFCAVLS
jgi:hypothetical protein